MRIASKALTLAPASVLLVLLLCSVREAVSESDVAAPSGVPPANVEDGADVSGERLFPGEENENQRSTLVHKRSRSTSSVFGALSPKGFLASSSLASKLLVAVTMVASALFLLYRLGDVVLKCLEETDSQSGAGSTPRSLSGAEGQGLNECVQRGVENLERGGGAARGTVYDARKDRRQIIVTVAAVVLLVTAAIIGAVFFNMTDNKTGHSNGLIGGVAAVTVISTISVAVQAAFAYWRLKYTESGTGKSLGGGMFLHYIMMGIALVLAVLLPVIQKFAGGVHWFSLAVVPVVLIYLLSPYFLGRKGKRDTGI